MRNLLQFIKAINWRAVIWVSMFPLGVALIGLCCLGVEGTIAELIATWLIVIFFFIGIPLGRIYWQENWKKKEAKTNGDLSERMQRAEMIMTTFKNYSIYYPNYRDYIEVRLESVCGTMAVTLIVGPQGEITNIKPEIKNN